NELGGRRLAGSLASRFALTNAATICNPSSGAAKDRRASEGPMRERMDKAMVALQAAAAGRKLYGTAHPAAGRQIELAADTIADMLATRGDLRVVRLDTALLFDDGELPSSAGLCEVLIPLLAAHGVEWIEFHRGVSRADVAG